MKGSKAKDLSSGWGDDAWNSAPSAWAEDYSSEDTGTVTLTNLSSSSKVVEQKWSQPFESKRGLIKQTWDAENTTSTCWENTTSRHTITKCSIMLYWISFRFSLSKHLLWNIKTTKYNCVYADVHTGILPTGEVHFLVSFPNFIVGTIKDYSFRLFIVFGSTK